jgi:hypothetical protein
MALIVCNAVFLERSQELFLKAHLAVVRLLAFDVLNGFTAIP